MKGALWRLPISSDDSKENNSSHNYTNEITPLEKLAEIDTTKYGNDLKSISYQPFDGTQVISVVDNNFALWDLNVSKPVATTVGTLSGKGQPKFTNGKWNPHNGCNQFVTLNENHVRGWDLRSPTESCWNILSAHSQIIR